MPEESLLIKSNQADSKTWHGTAFIVESLFLLLFIAVSVAVVVQLMGIGYSQSMHARELSRSVLLATTTAEQFAENPIEGNEANIYCESDEGFLTEVASAGNMGLIDFVEVEGAKLPYDDARIYVVSVDSTFATAGTGKLYNAHIAVQHQGVEVYALDTERYVPGDESEDGEVGELGETVEAGQSEEVVAGDAGEAGQPLVEEPTQPDEGGDADGSQ